MKSQAMGIIAIIAIIVTIGAIFYTAYYTSFQTVDITVKHKERVQYDDNSKYLIWSTQGEVFQNTDDFFLLKFDSSDLYGRLETGSNYTIKVIGWRVPFLSWYRNIIKVIK